MGEFHLETSECSLSLNSTCENIGNGLYESETLLSFQNNVLSENHVINSLASNNTLYLSVDTQFWLIDDVKKGSVSFMHKFPFCIETFTLSADFLLLGLSNGELHLLNINLQQLVARCDSIGNVWFTSRCFMGIYLEVIGGNAFLAVTKKGKVYSITTKKTEDNRIDLDSALLADFDHNITACTYANGQLVATGSKLIVYDLFTRITDEDVMPDHLELNNLYPCNESTFIGLKTDGMLCYVCPNTLRIAELQSEKLECVQFHCYAKKSYLYYLNADGTIKLVEFNNDGDVELTLDVENCVHLVRTSEEIENQMYMTRDASHLRVHSIVASKPEDRFRRLIRMRLFAEADAFALQHNLSRLEVNKAKVADYLENDSCTDAEVGELLRLMRDIPDGRFLAQACSSAVATCETLEGVDMLLEFVSDLDWQFEVKDRALELLLNATVSTFDAYTSLSRCKEVEVSVRGYRHFSHCDLFEYLIATLRQGKLISAIVVFSRLNSKYFTEENIGTILAYLDRHTLAEYTSFLSAIIPITLLHLPDALHVFVETISAKVHAVERERRGGEFPESAIEFVDRMLVIFDGNNAMHARSGAKAEDVAAIDLIGVLLNISTSLRTILELKNNYDIFLSLQDCLAGPGAILRALMRMNIKCIENFLKHFLIDFMIQNNIDADDVLAEEVGELLTCHHAYWAAHVPQVWRCIGSVGKRLELLVPVLRAAPKPWCDDIRQMLAEALTWNHPLVNSVQYEAQNEPKYVVMYRREYELRNETLESMEKDMFVIQRMIYCNLLSLIEDVYTLCTSKPRKFEASFFLLRHFIETDDLKSVFFLVNRLVPEERHRCFRALCQFYKQNAVLADVKLPRTLYTALSFIADNAAINIDDTSANTYRIIDVLPKHMRSYDLLTKLESVDGRRDVQNAIVLELCADIEDFKAVLHQCKVLAKAFNMPCDKLLFDVCQRSDDAHCMRECARELHENSDDVDLLSLMSVLIMRRVGREKDNDYDALFNDTIQNDGAGKPLDEQLLGDCLAMGRSLVAKALRLSGGKLNVANVFVWTLNTMYLRKYHLATAVAGAGEERAEKHPCRAYFPLGNGSSSMHTMSMFRSVFNMFCDYVQKDTKRPNVEYLAHRFPSASVDGESFGDDDNDDQACMSAGLFCSMLMARLNASVPAVLRENQHWTLLNLIVTLQSQLELRADPVDAQMRATFGKFKGKLLAKIFAAHAVHERLARALLLSYPRKKALKVVNDAMDLYKMNLEKYEAIVKLAMGITAFYQSTDHYSVYWLGIKWRKALSACSLPQKTFFVLCRKNELLDPLIAQGEIALDQITQFCADFQLDAPTYYLRYLHNLIATWKPTFEVQVDSFGNRALVVTSAEEDLIAKCLEVVPLINNRHAVLECVDKLWNATSFYHYEVFMAILSVAAHLNDARHFNFRAVLQFLRGYRRASKPSEIEHEEWCTRFLYQTLDGISEWRFPFSPMLFTADAWKMLRSEVKLANYERWFALTDLLKHLTRNEICCIAVKEVRFAPPEPAGGYNVSAKFEPVFDEIDKCLAHITDPVLAASMAFHLIHKPPEGADRVIASRLAYEYAKKCRNAGIDQPNYGMIERGYFAYSSKHILHVHQLATEQYVAMLDGPDELIGAMYKDARILKPSNSSLAQCPNINKASDELAALFQIDIRAKRAQLLQTWMSDANARLTDANETICLLPDAADGCEQNEECVLRAAYLCNSDVEHWRDHLNEMFQKSEDFLAQGRLLKTLCMISPPEYFRDEYNCAYADILVSINQFFVVHDIRSLDIMIDIGHLTSIDTNRLLYKLSKRLDDPKGVRVMIAVCDLYQVYDIKIWEMVIQAMIKLNMIAELKKCITLFIKENIMICRRVYVTAWQVVVNSMFEAVETGDQNVDAALTHVLQFIQSSPVLNRLNLAQGYWVCMKLKKHAYAIILLQYLPEAKRQEGVAELLRRESKENLVKSLERLQCNAFIGMKYVMDLL